MASSFQTVSVPAVIKGHQHFSYGGAVLPESVTVQQYYELTPTKKSNLRINDQLLPKPTDINMSVHKVCTRVAYSVSPHHLVAQIQHSLSSFFYAIRKLNGIRREEWMIKAVVQKKHPYQSHIPRYAMFPSYESPDDPHTGVRAASTLPLNPLLPSSAPAVTVLHKTKGSPYRHERLDVPMATKRETIVSPGHCGFQNPLKGDAQVLYPKPVKTVCPNASLRNWNITLSERNVNMLRNLEKAQWLTSYQLHYTGTGPSNPIKLDDFHEKTIAVITGEINPLITQLRERSFPTFVPSRPLEGRKARVLQNLHLLKSPSAPLPSPPSTSDLVLYPPVTAQKCAQRKDHVPHSLESEAYKTEQVTESNQSYEDKRSVPGFGSVPGRSEMSDLRCRETPSTDCRSFDENIQTMKSQLEKRNTYLSKGLQPRSFKGPKTDLRPRSTLLELQDSFRKSEAHQRFRQSIKDTEVDLRDNHDTGRKHTFCGFNSYYFHN